MHIVPRFETAGRVIPEFAGEGWLSPVEGTRLESEKAGFSEVCKILQIVSKVAPVNDLRAFKLFKLFRRFARVFTKIGADRRNGPCKFSPQFVALDSLPSAQS